MSGKGGEQVTLDVARWSAYCSAMARYQEELDDRSFAKRTGIPYSEIRERRLVQRMELSDKQMGAYQARIAGIHRRFDVVMRGR